MHIASHYVPHCLSIMPWLTTQYFSYTVSLHSFVMVPLYNFPVPLYPHLFLIALNPTPSIFGTYSSSFPVSNKYSVVPTTPAQPHPLTLSYLRTLNISSSPTAPLLACFTALLICSIIPIANRSRLICLPSPLPPPLPSCLLISPPLAPVSWFHVSYDFNFLLIVPTCCFIWLSFLLRSFNSSLVCSCYINSKYLYPPYLLATHCPFATLVSTFKILASWNSPYH